MNSELHIFVVLTDGSEIKRVLTAHCPTTFEATETPITTI